MNVKIREVMLTGSYKVELQSRELSSLPTHTVGVRNMYSLISPGTELALYTGSHIGFTDPDITWAKYPLRPGYASVGTVEEIGEGVDGLQVGDIVLHYQPHASFSVVDSTQDLIFKLPPDIDPRNALFARFGQIAYTAVAASQQKTGHVLIFGGGIVGNLCAQIFLRRKNRPVIVADISSSRLQLAKKCGIHSVLNPSQDDGKAVLSAESHEAGVNTVVEATGVPDLVASALEYVNPQGEVVLLGSTRGKVELDVYKMVHRKATMLLGAHEGRYPRFGNTADRAKSEAYFNSQPCGEVPVKKKNKEGEAGEEHGYSHDFFSRDVLSMIACHTVQVEPFITDMVAPENIKDAYQMLIDDRDSHIGILINWK